MPVETDVQAATLPRFEDAAKIAIAQLSPDKDNIHRLHIEANVALIWPYSSSTQRLSLLLAERDVRLRKTKGQVKVTFHDDCAREVAKTQVGIGDLINLGLEGATWMRTGEDVSTPGKKVDWDVNFGKRVQLELRRGEDITNSLDFTAESPSPIKDHVSSIEIAGPKVNGFIDIRNSGLGGNYLSPARQKHNRQSSGSFVDATLDPFADDDVYVSGRSRKRTKFARHSGAWRLMDTEKEVQTGSEMDYIPPSSPLNRNVDEEVGPDQAPSTHLADLPRTTVAESEPPVISPSQPSISASNFGIHEEGVSDEIRQRDTHVPQVESDTQLHEEPTTTVMGPPQVVSLDTSVSYPQPVNSNADDQTMTPTPVLRPLPSSGLASISPLVDRRNWNMGYFPDLTGSQSELDAISHPATEPPHLVDQISMSELVGSTNITQQEHLGTEAIADDRDIPHETLLQPHDINDLVGSGTALQNRVDEAVTDLLEDAILNQQDVDLDQPPVSPPSMRTFDVDLDALQQQIDESSQMWQDPVEPPETEDSDMYGPPSAHQRTPTTADPVLDVSQAFQIPGEEELVHFAHPQLQMEPIPVQAAAEKHIAPGQSESSQQVSNAHSPVLIESSEEDEDDSEEGSDEDDGSSELEEESNEDDDEEAMMPDDHIIDGSALNADVSTVEERSTAGSHIEPEPFPSPPISSMEKVSSTTSKPSFHDEHIAQTDGSDEAYEDEAERDRLRTNIDSNLPVDQTVVTDSNGSPVESQSETSSSSEASSELDNGDPEVIIEEPQLQVHEDTMIDVHDAAFVINDEAAQASLIEDAAFASQEAITPPARSLQPLNITEKPLQLITPDATQQHNTIEGPDTFQPSEILVTFPPTPIPTQGTVDPELPPSIVEVESRGIFDEENEALPSDIPEEQLKPLRRSTQRLSRKSFTSERVSNQYFTPRRSSRNIQSSPPRTKEPFPSHLQPSSLASAKQLLRGSPPADIESQVIETHQQERKIRGRTTPMSYYPYLSYLDEFYNLQVDVIAVCTIDSSPPQKAKTGPKDNHTTLCLADPSFEDNNTSIRAQFFRPRKDALPKVQRGDIALLRNMKVQTHEHNVMLSSTDSSSWAVFKTKTDQSFEIVISGPPIEYEEGEEMEAKRLLKWWHATGEDMYLNARNAGSNKDRVDARRSVSPIVTRSQARKANGSDQDGGNAEPSPPLASVSFSPTTPTKRQSHRRTNSNKSDIVVHTLRDGAKYVDGNGRQRSESVIHELRDGYTYVDE